MVLGYPLAMWIGIITFISLSLSIAFGIALHKYHKPVFRYHMLFAFLTIILAAIHVILVILMLYFGVSF